MVLCRFFNTNGVSSPPYIRLKNVCHFSRNALPCVLNRHSVRHVDIVFPSFFSLKYFIHNGNSQSKIPCLQRRA